MKEEEKKDHLCQPLTENKIKKTGRENRIKTQKLFNSPLFLLGAITDASIKNNIFIVPKKIGIAVTRNYLKRILRLLLQEYCVKKNILEKKFLIIVHKKKTNNTYLYHEFKTLFDKIS